MTLNTGKPVWYMDPELTPLELSDFRVPLENICRYNGGVKCSLMQHLALGVLLCELRFGSETAIARNIAGYYAAHDLHECIVGDIVSGMKKHLPGFRTIEQAWEQHVHEQIGLPLELSMSKEKVREIDLLALVVEMTNLGHPAVEIAKQNTGLNATPEELQSFQIVSSWSADASWRIITKTINTVRDELNGKSRNRKQDRHPSAGCNHQGN